MRITIVGAGAIGGLIGAWMTREGHEVTLVDRDHDHVAAIRAQGLAIEGPVASFTVHPTALTPDEAPEGAEVVAIAVKRHHTEDAARLASRIVAPDGVVLTIQNGLTYPSVARHVGKERVVSAFINIGSDVMAPGVIRQGNIAAFYVGEPYGTTITERVAKLAAALPFAEATDSILGYLWGKEAYGAMLWAGAVSDLSIADSLSDPRYHDLMLAVAREVLAQSPVPPLGFDGFEPHDLEGSLERLAAFNRASAKSHSGIYRDLMVRHRPTEVEGLLTDLAGPLTTHIARLIQAIERGERTCEVANLDLLACFERAHRLAAPLHAVVRYHDAPVRAPSGPLHGVTLAVKDNIAIEGVPRGNGNPIDARSEPSPCDATVVARARALGADVHLVTSMLEYALGIPHPEVPAARNPSNRVLTSGGSSGGSAVAVAVGAATLALGTDTGGSVRIPAHYVGVVGLKPSHGALPIDGVTPLATSLDDVGMLAPDVATLARGFHALTGTAPAPPPARLRVGAFVGQLDGELLDPEVAIAMAEASSRLARAGWIIEPLDPSLLPALDETFDVILGYEAYQVHRAQLARDRSHFGPDTARVLLAGGGISQDAYEKALARRAELVRELARALAGIDLVVGATAPMVAPYTDPAPDTPEGTLEGLFTRFWNLTGWPALSLPVLTAGLPVGLQLGSPHGDDAVLIAAAARCEAILAPSSGHHQGS